MMIGCRRQRLMWQLNHRPRPWAEARHAVEGVVVTIVVVDDDVDASGVGAEE